MNQTHRKQHLFVPLDNERKETALALIANMIVDEKQEKAGIISRIGEQERYKLLPEMIYPLSMPFERLVLRVLYTLDEQRLPANFENLLQRTRVEYPDAETRLLALKNYRTTPPDVVGLAFAIGDWIECQRMVIAAEAIVARMKSAEGSTNNKFQDAMKIMAEIAPISTQVEQFSLPEVGRSWRTQQKEREKLFAQGKAVGPQFPWPSLNKKITALKPGELCTIMAKSKHGKSTLALLIAEHMAHKQGFDVAIFHLETSKEVLYSRLLSRKAKVQVGAMQMPEVFKMSNPDHAQVIDGTEKELNRLDKEVGEIIFKPSAGISPSALRAECAKLLVKSQSRGRKLVVIIDYYQEIDWHELARDETAGYNAVASYLKNMSETLAAGSNDFYLIAFAQYGVDQDYGSKKAGFGGQKIVQRSQIVIRLEREDATDNRPIPSNKKDTQGQYIQEKDLIGVPMFYHEAGQPSSDAYLNVILANDGSIGPVPVKFVNGYYMVLDHPNEKVMMDTYVGKTRK